METIDNTYNYMEPYDRVDDLTEILEVVTPKIHK